MVELSWPEQDQLSPSPQVAGGLKQRSRRSARVI